MLCHFRTLTFLHNITLKEINLDSWSHSGREPCSVFDTSSNTSHTSALILHLFRASTNDARRELQLPTWICWEWKQAPFSGLKDSITVKLYPHQWWLIKNVIVLIFCEGTSIHPYKVVAILSNLIESFGQKCCDIWGGYFAAIAKYSDTVYIAYCDIAYKTYFILKPYHVAFSETSFIFCIDTHAHWRGSRGSGGKEGEMGEVREKGKPLQIDFGKNK